MRSVGGAGTRECGLVPCQMIKTASTCGTMTRERGGVCPSPRRGRGGFKSGWRSTAPSLEESGRGEWKEGSCMEDWRGGVVDVEERRRRR